jgi:cytochrome c553
MKTKILTLLLIVTFSSQAMAGGKSLYKNCAGCHGSNGKTKALSKSKVIAGQSSSKTVKQLTAYKQGSLNQYGLGHIMKLQVETLNSKKIKQLADYIAQLK